MTADKETLALLPNGFVDVLPPFAEGEARAIRSLVDQFLGFGYQLIKPPLLEFEESILAPGPGESLARETFRLMDPATSRMLGLRSDITAQVARIASSRLAEEKRPLRLTYANDVLRTRGNQMRTERQFTQVGCELIGGDLGLHGDIEICVLAVMGLRELGLRDITLDFTVPGFLDGVSDEVLKAAAQRDVALLRALDEDRLADVAQASSDLETVLAILGQTELRDLCAGVRAAFDDLGYDDVTISIDPLEQRGFEYHTDFGFTLFSAHVRGELGRGGAYDAAFARSGDAPAKGFTLYMDSVMRGVAERGSCSVESVSVGEAWSDLLERVKKGVRVVRA